MLSDIEQRELEHELQIYPYPENACIEALKIVQQHRGWVSDEGVQDIADFLGMSVEEVDNVATFYNLIYRQPVGKNVILICDSVSCWILGYEKILQKIEAFLGIKMGETTSDGLFTLLPVPCLGTCDCAPALMINEDLYRDLTPDSVVEILQSYRNGS